MPSDHDRPGVHLGVALREHNDIQTNGVCSALTYVQGNEEIELSGLQTAEYSLHITPLEHQEFWLSGTLKASVEQECSRCLKPTVVELSLDLATLLRFDPHIKEPYLDEDESDQEVWIFNDMWLDLSAYFSEAILMGLPLSVLHDPDCKGLCPSCGCDLNLNGGLCNRPDCIYRQEASPDEEIDTPFAALKDFNWPDG
ncbi:MAG: DUF177 domain-containing protein [Deinococcaceae bacterium]